ncbi:hypothetical protein CCR79_12715 [Halorhodospira halophila]|nr:hypothetical protein [Halorhodospira halophila]
MSHHARRKPRWEWIRLEDLRGDPSLRLEQSPLAVELSRDAIHELLLQRPILVEPSSEAPYRVVAGTSTLAIAKARLPAKEKVPTLHAPADIDGLRKAIDTLVAPTIEQRPPKQLARMWASAYDHGDLPSSLLTTPPTHAAIAQYLGISLSAYHKHRAD